jgi:hypothetical protein
VTDDIGPTAKAESVQPPADLADTSPTRASILGSTEETAERTCAAPTADPAHLRIQEADALQIGVRLPKTVRVPGPAFAAIVGVQNHTLPRACYSYHQMIGIHALDPMAPFAGALELG